MMTRTIDADDLDDTVRVAGEVASLVSPRTCIALEGDLGAGKTTFVRALVAALGGDARDVSSPTYVLLHTYQTPRMPVFHLDAYRIGGADDLDAIGFDELLDQPALVLVEWASRVAIALPSRDRIDIRIDVTGTTSRRFRIAIID